MTNRSSWLAGRLEAGEIEILDGLAVAAKATLSGPPQALDLNAVSIP